MRRERLLRAGLSMALVFIVAGCEPGGSLQPPDETSAVRSLGSKKGSDLEGIDASIASFSAIANDPKHYHLVSLGAGNEQMTAADMVASLKELRQRYLQQFGVQPAAAILTSPTKLAKDMGCTQYCYPISNSGIWLWNGYPPNSRTADFHGATNCMGYGGYPAVTRVDSRARMWYGPSTTFSNEATNQGTYGYAVVDMEVNVTGVAQQGSISTISTCTSGGVFDSLGYGTDSAFSSAAGNV